jgi:chromosome segregation protein
MAREDALQRDAAGAIGELESERAAIALRLADAEAQGARIAAELTRREAGSREAEAALAEVLARQAAMRAERRVAEAAQEAARNQLARTEGEQAKLAEQLRSLGDGAAYVTAQEQAKRAAAAASEALTLAEQQRLEAEAGRASAAGQRDAAEAALSSARAALAAVRSENDVLTRSLQQGGGTAIAALSAEPGFEQALAAALGDDADAPVGFEGPRCWQGSAPLAGDPRLPAGTDCLAEHVTAPAELERRLRQVAVVHEDAGQDLAVGQRLVTHDGRLRRWDGFVASGIGAAAADRLIRANRLADLQRQLPELGGAVSDALAGRDASLAQLDILRGREQAARQAAVVAEHEAREAARADDQASAMLERLEAQRTNFEQRQADLAPVLAAARDAVAAAERSLAGLPEPGVLERDVETTRATAASAAAMVADTRAEAATRARETAADRERSSAAGREQASWRKRLEDAEQRLAQALERQRQLADEQRALQAEPAELDESIAALERENSDGQLRIGEAAAAERDAEQAVAAANAEVAAANERFADARERRAAATATAEAQQTRSAEFARACVDKFECLPQRLPEAMRFDPGDVGDPGIESAELDRLTAERERIGPVNLVAETELAELDEARGKGAAEAEELTQAIHRLRGSIGNLNREGRVRLLQAYEKVDGHFRRLFTTLFDGGQAHLELVESDDPLEAGLEIMAQPPGKRLSTLTLLSGGEQALTAIALIFAIFLTNPAPICVLDEVDAPLDDANVERFCELLDRMTDETDTRYLIVTHNAVTMSRMHRLYGVTMIEKGVSRLVSVDLGGAETLIAAE